MLPRLLYVVIFATLPFFIEGVAALQPAQVLEPRQTFTATSNTPTTSTYIILNDISTFLTSCTPTNVTWTYAGPIVPLGLIATNNGVIQDPPPNPLPSRPPSSFTDGHILAVPSAASQAGKISVTIAEDANPQASQVPWEVNVPSGWYQILAEIDTTFQIQTDPFYVQSGSDTSCISGTTSSSTTSSSSKPTAGTSTPTPTASSVPVETVAPVTTTSKDSRVGVIAGVVAAVVVFMIVILLAYLWLRKRKGAVEQPVVGKSGGAHLRRGWGGLGSIGSAYSTNRLDRRSRTSRDLTSATRNTPHLPTDSIGAGFSDDDFRSGNSTPFSPYDEKFYNSPATYTNNPFDDSEGGLALAPIPSNGSRALSPSRTSLPQIGTVQPIHLRSSSVDSLSQSYQPTSNHGRNASFDTSPPISYQYSSSTSPPVVHMERTYSASSTGHAPSTSQKAAHRESTGSQSIAARKTPRKPVPVYDPSIPTSSTHASSNASPTGYVPSPITPTMPSTPFNTSNPQGHYSKRSLHSNNGPELGGGLVHKSSFGPGGVEGKPMHYLIPDMPLSN